jgi:hypothetical protein
MLQLWCSALISTTAAGQNKDVPRFWSAPLIRSVLPAVLMALIVVSLVAIPAYLSLNLEDKAKVHVEIAKLSCQFLLIVLLGLLVNRSVEVARERGARMDAQRERQSEVLRSLISVSHRIDAARTFIRANRSVKTWTVQMNDQVIPVYTDLRDIYHNARASEASRQPVFREPGAIDERVTVMHDYIRDLVEEFAERKKDLAELQLTAEKDRSLQSEIWQGLLALDVLGDLIKGSTRYKKYRDAYVGAVAAIYKELGERPPL